MKTMENDDVVEIESQLEEQTNQGEVTADTLRILEALLFASDELLSAARIKAILPDNPDARQIRKMVDKINVQLQKERHPFEIVEIGGGYQFRTVAYFHPWVRQIFKEKAAKKLSMQALECLAIIAYKQPVSKAEIEAVRGVVSDGAMKTLLEKKLVTISGRSDKPGKPLQYSTTHEFLRYFGLNKIEDLPRIEEFEAIAREKIEDLSFEELTGENTDEGGTIDDPENKQIESEQQPNQSGSVDSPEPTAVFEVNNNLEKLENEGTLGSDQPGSQCTISNSEADEISEQCENIETQSDLSPEPTSVFETHDSCNTEDTEEAQKKDALNEEPIEPQKDEVKRDSEIITEQELPGQTVENPPPPEPTAVFEIHGFFDELEAEASAEEKTEQNNHNSSNTPVGAVSKTSPLPPSKKSGENTVNTFPAQDMVEFETAEITVDQNEESGTPLCQADKPKAATESAVGKKGAVKTTKSVQEEEETLEVFIPQASVSQQSEESVQQKKSFFSKIRKKKKEEPEE